MASPHSRESGGWVEMDPGIRDLASGFIAHRREDVKRLLAALEQKDFETIQTLDTR